MLVSTRRAILYPNPDRSDAPDVPLHIKNVIDALELDVYFTSDVLANRPISTIGSPGKVGRMFQTTDQTPTQIFWDYGTGWLGPLQFTPPEVDMGMLIALGG